jgi:hypothetical protein
MKKALATLATGVLVAGGIVFGGATTAQADSQWWYQSGFSSYTSCRHHLDDKERSGRYIIRTGCNHRPYDGKWAYSWSYR